MPDNVNYLLYKTIKIALDKIEKVNRGRKKNQKIEKPLMKLKIAIDELFLSRRKCFDEIFDQQLNNFRERNYPQEVIDSFCEIKSQVIGQLVETSIDSEFSKIPFVLVIEHEISDALLLNVKSIKRIVKSYIRFPSFIINRRNTSGGGSQVLLDIQFHNCCKFDSLKELKDYIEGNGRYCLTLCEFDYLFLHYPKTFGRFHCIGTYFEKPENVLTISISEDEAIIGAVPYNGKYHGMAISFGYRIY